VPASEGSGPCWRNWRGQSRNRASGRPPTRRFSSPHALRCGASRLRRRAGTTLFRRRIPSSSGAARTAAVSMLRSRASTSASGGLPSGWMRPATSWPAQPPPLIARLSGRWLDCSPGSRSRRRAPGTGSRACVPCKGKRGAFWTHRVRRGPTTLVPLSSSRMGDAQLGGQSGLVPENPLRDVVIPACRNLKSARRANLHDREGSGTARGTKSFAIMGTAHRGDSGIDGSCPGFRGAGRRAGR